MRFLSVCSGIEAASVAWTPLGWEAVAFSEIEPFPCAVLAHRYPSVPNWGDMTKFQEWPDADVDLLCGGTPCQSFSVAGLRKGLADPRGNLMLTFGSIAAKYRPRWLVWENVPGVLSSNGGRDFGAFLDMLESLGYVCDIEILDAQFFGVPQRRRRVFVCAQHRDDLLSQKTDTSALTIAQCLQEILLCILSEARSRFGSEQGSSDLPSRSKDGAKRRMELFGLAGEADCWPMLLENLAAAFRRLPQEQRPLDATHGEPAKEPMPGVQSTDSQTASLFTLTEQSLKNALDDALEVMRLFITSTETSSTTQAQIFSCSRAALLIAQLTQRLSQSSPAFWNSALSSLTTVEEFTDYARSTSSDLFGDLERLQSWCDFIKQAEHSNDTFLGFGVECFGEIFPLPDCLQGHPAPRREQGKVAPTIPSRSTGGGGLGTDFDCDGGLIHADQIARCDTAGEAKRQDWETCNFVAHTLKGEGFDASEDGTGRGTQAVSYAIQAGALRTNPASGPDGVGVQADHAYTLEARAEVQAVAFAQNSRDEVRLEGGDGQRRGALSTGGGKPGQGVPMVATAQVVGAMSAAGATERKHGFGWGQQDWENGYCQPTFTMQVRRLTPVECARLQGFPDDYLDIIYRGKPAADGPKYKALGNSWAVPVVRWIGARIQEAA